MRYFIGTDHAGVNIKNSVISFLKDRGFEVADLSPAGADSVDYPDFAQKVCREVLKDSSSRGILICGSGIGMSMAANRFPKIRAALCLNSYMAKMSRAHNDANVLCLGERLIGTGLLEDIVEAFVSTDFEGGRHEGRIQKIDNFKGAQ